MSIIGHRSNRKPSINAAESAATRPAVDVGDLLEAFKESERSRSAKEVYQGEEFTKMRQRFSEFFNLSLLQPRAV